MYALNIFLATFCDDKLINFGDGTFVVIFVLTNPGIMVITLTEYLSNLDLKPDKYVEKPAFAEPYI